MLVNSFGRISSVLTVARPSALVRFSTLRFRRLTFHFSTLTNQSRLSQLTSERDALIKGATEAISGPLYAARAKRADVALLQRRVEEVQQHVGVLRKDNDAGAYR